MKNHSVILVFVFASSLFSSSAVAEQFFCEGTIKGSNFLKQVKVTVNEDMGYLLALEPVKPGHKSEIYSDVPVGIGEIEIAERSKGASLVIASGKLIVTDYQRDLIAGLLIHQGRQFSIRLDRSNNKWTFILHDANHKETTSGVCK